MRRRKWILTALLGLSLVLAGMVLGQTLAQHRAGPLHQKTGYICPLTGAVLPGPEYCPLSQAR